MKHTLVFRQEAGEHGSCKCFLNDQLVDGCDMNHDKKYTQAHVVIASAYRTLKSKDIEITIEAHQEAPSIYPLDNLLGMADCLINKEFEDLYGYTRIYPIK